MTAQLAAQLVDKNFLVSANFLMGVGDNEVSEGTKTQISSSCGLCMVLLTFFINTAEKRHFKLARVVHHENVTMSELGIRGQTDLVEL